MCKVIQYCGLTHAIIIIVDAYYVERNGLYIGQGRAMMSRAGMFRALEGIAVDMSNRVFKLPSFRGIVHSLQNFLHIFPYKIIGCVWLRKNLRMF